MKRSYYDLKYDRKADRWTVNLGSHTYGLHCGECFELRIGDRNIPCRLEYGNAWYVILDDTRFNLRIRDTYKVKM
ncbi:hypothetical protein JCM15765_24310 [Paradesulfitobacterium aromaticivorans]